MTEVAPQPAERSERDTKGIARIKPEFIKPYITSEPQTAGDSIEEDEVDAEAASERILLELGGNNKKKRRKHERGQNKKRDNRQAKERNQLCPNLITTGDVSSCPFGDQCRYNHNLNSYLEQKKPEIESEYFRVCPIFASLGYCPMGYRCRFLSSHLDKETKKLITKDIAEDDIRNIPIFMVNKTINQISPQGKIDLVKRKFQYPRSDEVLLIMDAIQRETELEGIEVPDKVTTTTDEAVPEKAPQVAHREKELKEEREKRKEIYLKYKDTRYFSQEKRRLDYRGKKILSPLTTVGNLPYRRLMKKYGCDITFSEMALAVPLIQGANSEWALPKCHISEKGGYSVQIACSKPWQAAKACEALVGNLLHSPSFEVNDKINDNDINEINLNAGCPIDLLYRQGSGSALLENPARMIRCLNAMNYASQEVPITVKIRSGTKDGHPVAEGLVKRLVWETDVAGITLHGRSRQQRYTKQADWQYISTVSKALREAEINYNESEQAKEKSERPRIQFLGNGDVNNFEDWYKYLDSDPNMDSIMVARGALIKPWIFEEIEAQQYLDKSSTERLEILRDYAMFSMEHWGTDEYGISQCRRFFCEFMSFFHRYIPMGICERYPVRLNERPPNWIGRDDMESLLGSTSSKDWIKLSEMFFGKADDSFIFTPKHKSSSY